MTKVVNPFDHLPEEYLKRKLASISRKMVRNAMRGKKMSNFEEQRVLMLSISDSLTRKKELSWLETVSKIEDDK